MLNSVALFIDVTHVLAGTPLLLLVTVMPNRMFVFDACVIVVIPLEWLYAPLPTVNVDSTLVKQVLTLLIGLDGLPVIIDILYHLKPASNEVCTRPQLVSRKFLKRG